MRAPMGCMTPLLPLVGEVPAQRGIGFWKPLSHARARDSSPERGAEIAPLASPLSRREELNGIFEFSEKTLDRTSSAMIGYRYRCKNDSCFCEKRNDAHVQSPGRNVRTCCRALKTVQVDTFRPGHLCFGAFLFGKNREIQGCFY